MLPKYTGEGLRHSLPTLPVSRWGATMSPSSRTSVQPVLGALPSWTFLGDLTYSSDLDQPCPWRGDQRNFQSDTNLSHSPVPREPGYHVASFVSPCFCHSKFNSHLPVYVKEMINQHYAQPYNNSITSPARQTVNTERSTRSQSRGFMIQAEHLQPRPHHGTTSGVALGRGHQRSLLGGDHLRCQVTLRSRSQLLQILI